ncbi:MAG TPA: Clp protease N-terminal domain-containing protein [Phycisphaerae bacterium]|nr:Clp protease N-terminal domain-containing protein [Phycisphaerae bacterium]HOJ73782.1 Clp protease N-terminal domain-containing protein [Phycisphaerae bacterium]HOM50429.1 Clp protease N-terminal domain-containing protein [Phycisphaerae bacterium]HON65475.1 Clp protease N-terminal domain-containing protein [Phycisphaerae bacterium]HOQ84159.1 Clp protease N-terminal domain-containing protein [Phycisphaerae bacterium]
MYTLPGGLQATRFGRFALRLAVMLRTVDGLPMNVRNLTKEAETIIALAKEFARQYGQNYVGTEHLLLAILGQEDCLGAKVLAELSVDQDRAKQQIDELLKARLQETWVMGRLPGTPHYRDVLARAAEEAKGSGNWQIRSEHLLLGLLAEKASTGCKALMAMGVDPIAVRKALGRNRVLV